MALSGGLAACGGGSSKTATTPTEPPPPEPTAQEMCEDAGGRWNADMTCTTAAQLAAEKEAATAAAVTKQTAIAAELAQTATGGTGDAGLGGTGATIGTAEGNYSLAVANDRAVTITVHGATDDDDENFIQAMDLGGGTTMHTRTMDADDDGNVMQEVVIVTTDRAAPMPVAFVDYENASGTKDQALNLSTDTTNDTPDVTNEALTVATTAFGQLMSSEFTSTTDAVLTFSFDDTSTTDMDEADEVAGTYNGAMGTYRCNGTSDCTVTITDGEISAISDGWIFTPAMNAMSSQQDNDYLYYGFWLKKTTDGDGAVTYNEVETFAMAMGPGHTTSSGTITGSASYSGGATGVYVRHVYSSGGGSIESSSSGHFTADASLTATFAQTVDDPATTGVNEAGQIAPNMLNRLTGTIDNFMLSGGEMNDWSVALAGTVGDDGAVTEGTAKGGMGDGQLAVSFYGAADTLPVAATGEFNAGFHNGSVAGAFGVNKDEE